MLSELTLNSFALANAKALECIGVLEETFGCEFHLYSEEAECLQMAVDVPLCNEGWMLEMIRAAANQRSPQLLAEENSIAVLAVPLESLCGDPSVAVAPFVTEPVAHNANSLSLSDADIRLLGIDAELAEQWINEQAVWPIHCLERMAHSTSDLLRQHFDRQRIDQEFDKVSTHLANCYEEISLLHSITQNFRISITDEELGRQVLDWLASCIACEGLCMVFLPVAKKDEVTYKARTETLVLKQGSLPFDHQEVLLDMLERFEITFGTRPVVINRNDTESEVELPAGVRQMMLSPLVEDVRVFGYLVAFNHQDNLEFGTVEANLLASVGAMLGIHSANRDLYREQSEQLACVVRVLTSAIDAKDQYTCGHSDRVARVATRIAQELGCEKEFLHTIYMAGLLHDVGKIGIDDSVLNKTGPLTPEEFEHIKQHPALGYKILADIKQLAPVLPAVLHHHEQWDGAGYPCNLAGEQIPYIARIVAVADAYDAMTSNRSYRPGMPDEKVHTIFTKGAGRQWDPAVVEAYFACADDIRAIVDNERAELSLDVQQWL
jgi:HD-GYP domain-containing protein (c-di-GMP phosphodiesterase class II)